MEDTQIIVLAAGRGKRMQNSTLPKVLAPLHGQPLIDYIVATLQQSNVHIPPLFVVGHGAEHIRSHLGEHFTYVHQAEQRGTGHAVRIARPAIPTHAQRVLVLYGDKPFIKAETIQKIVQRHRTTGSTITLTTVQVPHYRDRYEVFFNCGRIIRNTDGSIEKIIELKDATDIERHITEVNTSNMCFDTDWLRQNIDTLRNDNVQGEYYLTDLLHSAFQQGEKVTALPINPAEGIGINTAGQLAAAHRQSF